MKASEDFNNIKTNIILPILDSVHYLNLAGHVSNHLIYYSTPVSLTYAWSFGFLAGMCLLIQMISGIFLAMHYTPHIDLAFSSVEYIMRDVSNGYFHVNVAFMFFIVVYSHIFRGLYYGSYMKPRELLLVFRSNFICFNDGYGIYRLCASFLF